MKKKLIQALIPGVGLVLTLSENLNALSCYLEADESSQVVASSITGPVVTGCDRYDVDAGYKISAYVWAGPNDDATLAWQTNAGTIRDTVLSDVKGLMPDVAIVTYRCSSVVSIYAVVAYKNGNNGYAQWEAFKWNGTDFGASNALYTTSSAVTTAIHVDADENGFLEIVWDESNQIINYSGGDINRTSPYSLSIANTFKQILNVPVNASYNASYPDVAIAFDAGDTSTVVFSWAEEDGSGNYNIVGVGFYWDDLYTFSGGGAHTNIQATINSVTYEQVFLNSASYNSGAAIGKTSISMTQRHATTYKFQPQLAWEEDDSGDRYIIGSARYWDGYTTTSTGTFDNMTSLHGLVVQDIHSGPQVISAKNGDYMVIGWNYDDPGTNSNCLANKIEPVTAPESYNKNASSPSTSASSDFYLGIGKPSEHNGTTYPLNTLNALSMAGKQSADILYFFFDDDADKLYSKALSASAAQLRTQSSSISEEYKIVYPNPINSNLFLNLPEVSRLYHLLLYDVSGRNILNSSGTKHYLEREIRKIESLLMPGIYMIKIFNEEFVKSQLINKL